MKIKDRTFTNRSKISSLADERRRWTIRWDPEERNRCTNGAQENKGGVDGRQQKEQRGGDRAQCKCAQEEEVRRMTQ